MNIEIRTRRSSKYIQVNGVIRGGIKFDLGLLDAEEAKVFKDNLIEVCDDLDKYISEVSE